MTMLDTLTDSLKSAAKSAVRHTIGPAIGVCVVAYFAYYAVQGDRGLIAMKRIQGEIAQAEATLETLKAERERMDRRAQLLRNDNLDPDMLEERARSMLNLSGQRDVVIKLPPLRDQAETGSEKQPKSAD